MIKKYQLEVSGDEMEYIQCALTVWIQKNAENAQKYGEMLDREMGNMVEGLWAPQHVEASNLLDRLVSISGYNLCEEGQ